MSLRAILAAAAGMATFAALVSLTPGTAAGQPLALLAAVLQSGWFAGVFVGVVALLGGLLLLLRGRGRSEPAGHLATPLLWGAAAPLASLLLDPWFFHGTAYVTALTGLALGALASLARRHRMPHRPPPRDDAAVIVLLAALAIGVPTFLALPGPPWFHPVSGDEPHYLVTARSLWVDGGLNLVNEYERGLTRPFWPVALPAHAKPGVEPGALYSIHGTGLAVWLAPWFGLGQGLSETAFNVLVRFAMSLWLAGAAVALFFLLRVLMGRAGRAVALPGTLLALLTLPLLFAGPHLFPAVPAFALSCGAYVLLRGGGAGPSRSPDAPITQAARAALSAPADPRRALAAGVLLAGLPWLHFKFFGLMVAVALAGAWFLRPRSDGRMQVAATSSGGRRASGAEVEVARGSGTGAGKAESREGSRQESPRPPVAALVALAVPIVLSVLGHMAFTWSLYGRLSPLAIHVGADPTLRATAQGDDLIAYFADPIGALTTLIGYFLDQREGLLFYAPHYLLAVAGFAWLWRRRRVDAVALLAALAALVVPYALSQETGHWAPPARPLTGVLWILAAGMGVGLALPAGKGPIGWARTALRAVLVTWGACATVLLLLQADLLYHEYSVPRALVLLRYGAPGLPLADLAPLWLGPDAVRWVPSLVGLALALALAVFLWRWGSEAARHAPEPGWWASPAAEAWVAPPAAPPMSTEEPAGASHAAIPGALARCVAAAFVLVAAALMLWHHARVPVSDLHQQWSYGPVRYWRPLSPLTRAWAEPEGLWTGGHDTVRLLLSSREPIDTILLDLDTLAPMRAEVQLGRDRQAFRLTPGARSFARLRPGPGLSWQGEYFYHLEVVAQGGISRAALGIGEDSSGLGVLLRVREVQ